MAGEPTVLGTTVIVGFKSGETVSGIIRDSHDTEQTADIDYIRDESNNEATAVVSNLGKRLVISGTCSAEQTTRKGAVVTVNSVKYVCENAVERRTKLACRFELTLYKPDQMTLA